MRPRERERMKESEREGERVRYAEISSQRKFHEIYLVCRRQLI